MPIIENPPTEETGEEQAGQEKAKENQGPKERLEERYRQPPHHHLLAVYRNPRSAALLRRRCRIYLQSTRVAVSNPLLLGDAKCQNKQHCRLRRLCPSDGLSRLTCSNTQQT